MSARLDALLDPQRAADCAAHDDPPRLSRLDIIAGLRRCRDEGLPIGQRLLRAAVAEFERSLIADAHRRLGGAS